MMIACTANSIPGNDAGDPSDEPAWRALVPLPPSTNNLYVNVEGKLHGGRRKGPAYGAWLKYAGWEILRQRPATVAMFPTVMGAVRVLIEAPLSRRRDLDNALKPLLDLLVKQRIIADDNLIDDLRIVRRGEGDMVTVSIWPMP